MGGDYQIGLDVLIGASSGVLGAIGAYVKLRSTLDLVAAENVNQEKEINNLRERKKEMNSELHKRVDDLRGEFSDLQKEVHQGQQKLETHMAQMELRIVKEIQKMAEKLTNK